MHQQFSSYAERMEVWCAASTNPRWSEQLHAENCRHERKMGVFEDPDHVVLLQGWKVPARLFSICILLHRCSLKLLAKNRFEE